MTMYKNIFGFNTEWGYKNISILIFLLILPNFLGMINLPTVMGFKIHFFQIAIFAAAIKFGPLGGLFSGLVGSFYSAFIMNNPYIVAGNMILGFFIGFFIRNGFNIFLSVLIAFTIQVPWLFLTDYYLAGLSLSFIYGLIAALLVSNLVWATLIFLFMIKPNKK